MRIMSIHRRLFWLTLAGSILFPATLATAQPRDISMQYGTVEGPSYAYGNAPYSAPNPTGKPAHTPFAPVQFDHDWQPFAPADISEYGNSPKRRYGFFASYERLYWAISKPPTAMVGSESAQYVGNYYEPNTNLELPRRNSFDTGVFNGDFGWGNRYDLGWVDMDNKGWLVSILSNLSQNQTFGHGPVVVPDDDDNTTPPTNYGNQGGTILFDDPLGLFINYTDWNDDGFDDDRNGNNIYGRDGEDTDVPPDGEPNLPYFPPDSGLLPDGDQVRFAPTFLNVKMTNRVEFNGVELMRTWRIPRFHDGSDFQWLFGVRYLQVKDRFTLLGSGGLFDSTWMNTTIQNEIVGPQVGFRWSLQRSRWSCSAEGRFMAGANFQNGNQYWVFLSEVETPPIRNAPALTVFSARNAAHNTEFTPLGELRVQTSYYLTRAVALKVGYTLLYADGIQRASNSVVYQVPDGGIKNNHGDDYILTNGLSFGIEVNR